MNSVLVYPIGITPACRFAAEFLKEAGICLTDHPSPEVTHLLLDVPSFSADGSLRGGGRPETVLERLPADLTVIGGRLNHFAVSSHAAMDLLEDPEYLARNAAISADCALQVAAPKLSATLDETPTLIIGWGRIGKCLSQKLTAWRCPVTIAARNPEHRAMAAAFGLTAIDIPQIPCILPEIRLVFNTVPAPVLAEGVWNRRKNCVKIDLASLPGLSGEGIIYARGLPGQYAPESSGRLIANSILKRLKEASL